MERTLAALLAVALVACGSSSAVPPAEGPEETHAADPADPADPAPADPAEDEPAEAEPAAAACNEVDDCPPGRILPAYTETAACVEHRCVYSGHVTDPEANAP